MYVMVQNHYHVVVCLDADQAASWSVDEVLARWTQLFAGHPLVQSYLANPSMGSAELGKVKKFVELYRARLGELSWFSSCFRFLSLRRN